MIEHVSLVDEQDNEVGSMEKMEAHRVRMIVASLLTKHLLIDWRLGEGDFFSSPRNLALITPKRLNFEILSISGGEKIFKGQVILYKIKGRVGWRCMMSWNTPCIGLLWVYSLIFLLWSVR